MLVFLYEFVTGGGWWEVDSGRAPAGSLRAEGEAMIRALAEDFVRVPDCQVVCLTDDRLAVRLSSQASTVAVAGAGDEQEKFRQCARRSDWTVVVAPEFNGLLDRRVEWVERAGGRLLSPDRAFVRLAADKQATADHLLSAGVAAPRGRVWQVGQAWPAELTPPLVAKPVDGAGSWNVRLLRTFDELQSMTWGEACWRIEPFHPGWAASVAVLAGPAGNVVLAPARQWLSDEGRFQYYGGQVPWTGERAERAAALAGRVSVAMPATRGYYGIDMVLGELSDGSGDVVIEVNPRLTTSYVGLRQVCSSNLAAAMLDVAAGRLSRLSFDRTPVDFRV